VLSSKGELRKDRERIKLQGQPAQILVMLLRANGEVVTRESLRQALWSSDTFVDFEHSLNTAVKKLRRALGDDADNQSTSKPSRGLGTGSFCRRKLTAQPAR
jgi:DNA-binding winged helix-turn-helix (wHTH) protein